MFILLLSAEIATGSTVLSGTWEITQKIKCDKLEIGPKSSPVDYTFFREQIGAWNRGTLSMSIDPKTGMWTVPKSTMEITKRDIEHESNLLKTDEIPYNKLCLYGFFHNQHLRDYFFSPLDLRLGTLGNAINRTQETIIKSLDSPSRRITGIPELTPFLPYAETPDSNGDYIEKLEHPKFSIKLDNNHFDPLILPDGIKEDKRYKHYPLDGFRAIAHLCPRILKGKILKIPFEIKPGESGCVFDPYLGTVRYFKLTMHSTGNNEQKPFHSESDKFIVSCSGWTFSIEGTFTPTSEEIDDDEDDDEGNELDEDLFRMTFRNNHVRIYEKPPGNDPSFLVEDTPVSKLGTNQFISNLPGGDPTRITPTMILTPVDHNREKAWRVEWTPARGRTPLYFPR